MSDGSNLQFYIMLNTMKQVMPHLQVNMRRILSGDKRVCHLSLKQNSRSCRLYYPPMAS
jgi:hypothetical protein